MKLFHVGLTACEGKWLSKEFSRRFEYAEILPNEDPRKIEAIYNSFKPDIVFFQIQNESNGRNLTPLAQRFSHKSFVLNWSGDVREPLPGWYREFGKHCITAFSNMDDVNKMGCEYLQIGIDPEIYMDHGLVKTRDICFFANRSACFPLSGFRQEVTDFLRSQYKERFRIYGWWPGANGNFNSDQHAESRLYNSSKIAISISHFSRDRYFSDRLIRAMGSRCFTLSHDYPGIDKDFKVGVHLDTFRSKEELKEKIDYYTKYDKLREEIADAGCKLVHEKFTVKNMVDDVLRIYEKNKSIH